MKYACASLMAAVVFALSASGVVVEPLPAPEFVDTEVSAHHPLVQGSFGLRGLDFRLEFIGTPSNNVGASTSRARGLRSRCGQADFPST